MAKKRVKGKTLYRASHKGTYSLYVVVPAKQRKEGGALAGLREGSLVSYFPLRKGEPAPRDGLLVLRPEKPSA